MYRREALSALGTTSVIDTVDAMSQAGRSSGKTYRAGLTESQDLTVQEFMDEDHCWETIL